MITLTRTAVRLTVRVQPRAARDRVVGVQGEAIKLQVTAAPVDGAANDAVIALLADWLDVRRAAVRLLLGHGGRSKVVEVSSDDPAGLAARVRERLAGSVPPREDRVDKARSRH
jgi:uncharacterized protein (TIGR00251 family)